MLTKIRDVYMTSWYFVDCPSLTSGRTGSILVINNEF